MLNAVSMSISISCLLLRECAACTPLERVGCGYHARQESVHASLHVMDDGVQSVHLDADVPRCVHQYRTACDASPSSLSVCCTLMVDAGMSFWTPISGVLNVNGGVLACVHVLYSCTAQLVIDVLTGLPDERQPSSGTRTARSTW